MRLYLIRHGETALNVKGCYYGRTDAVLSEKGIAHLEGNEDYMLLHKYLRNLKRSFF